MFVKQIWQVAIRFLVIAKKDDAVALKVNESCIAEIILIGAIPWCIYTLSRSAMICILKNY
ncbi:hypothetical protein CIG75_02570 [Tumebacillus algifaecis]|uniref:Uncharacterized protein n=1 Tax=Tumebacillus algifaecis TaxID=1214604 RepID=A0A223CXY9_9BACL|nr:hypothetical protein CIG75_02570 [Tumebacillus algifaecis]